MKNLIFKYRSYTPIPWVLLILYFSDPKMSYFVIGLPLLILGELIRMWAVSYAGIATRTLTVGAPSLCTSGPYGFVRNPLYIGNVLIYVGFSFMFGASHELIMAISIFSFFMIQYFIIVSLEEETLFDLFGQEYLIYRENVRAIVPRITPWRNDNISQQSPAAIVFRTERRTLQAIIIMSLLLVVRVFFPF